MFGSQWNQDKTRNVVDLGINMKMLVYLQERKEDCGCKLFSLKRAHLNLCQISMPLVVFHNGQNSFNETSLYREQQQEKVIKILQLDFWSEF